MALKHDWTHYLICFENVGNGLKRKIFKRCKIVMHSNVECKNSKLWNGLKQKNAYQPRLNRIW